MVDIDTLFVFVPAALALVLAPGPDTFYVLTQSIERGRYVGVSSAVGISTGVVVHTCAAILGLSVILRQSALVFRLVKYIGGLYLVYLGIKTIWSSSQFESDVTYVGAPRNYRASFVRGVLVNVLNPKVALFFLAFLPQFVNSTGSIPLQLFLLGGLYSTLTLCYLAGVGFFAGTIRHALSTYSSVERIVRGVMGSILVGLGVQLSIDRKLSV